MESTYYWALTILSGVAAGFVATYAYQWLRDRRTKEIYKEAFGTEIDDSITKLKNRKLELLPHAVWDAAAHSGALGLFCADQVIALSMVYSGNSNFNYEAVRTRDLNERFNWTADPALKKQVHLAWGVAEKRAFEVGDSALRMLKVVAEKEWFQTKAA